MKSHYKKTLVLIIGFFCSFFNNIEAQDTTTHFILNVRGIIYSQQEKSPNYFLYPTPEIEVLYKIQSFKTLSVFTGVQYIYSYSKHDLGYKSEWRRKAHEIAFPLFVEQCIGNFISIKGGAVIGYLIKGKEEYKSNIPAHKEWKDVTDQTDYDESSRFYIGLYFDPRFKYDFDAWNTISIGPTVRYYIKDNWMKKVRHKAMIGISLQYSFRF